MLNGWVPGASKPEGELADWESHFALLVCRKRSAWSWATSRADFSRREQRDRNMEREKLAAALIIFTDLKMLLERRGASGAGKDDSS